MAVCDSFVGFAILVNKLLKAVPADDAFIPLFAISPRAVDTS